MKLRTITRLLLLSMLSWSITALSQNAEAIIKLTASDKSVAVDSVSQNFFGKRIELKPESRTRHEVLPLDKGGFLFRETSWRHRMQIEHFTQYDSSFIKKNEFKMEYRWRAFRRLVEVFDNNLIYYQLQNNLVLSIKLWLPYL